MALHLNWALPHNSIAHNICTFFFYTCELEFPHVENQSSHRLSLAFLCKLIVCMQSKYCYVFGER